MAYVRYASVYRNFAEAKDFEEFVGTINELELADKSKKGKPAKPDRKK